MGKINLGYLESMTNGDSEVIREMLELLIDETPKHLANIKKAHDEKNWVQLRSEAHKIKPMMLYVGLTELNEISKELEANAKEVQNLQSNPVLISKLENGFYNVLEDLKTKITELSSN